MVILTNALERRCNYIVNIKVSKKKKKLKKALLLDCLLVVPLSHNVLYVVVKWYSMYILNKIQTKYLTIINAEMFPFDESAANLICPLFRK